MTQIEIFATKNEAKRELDTIEDRIEGNLARLEKLKDRALPGLALDVSPKDLDESLAWLIARDIEKLHAQRIVDEMKDLHRQIVQTRGAIERARKDPDLDLVSLSRFHGLSKKFTGFKGQLDELNREVRDLNKALEQRRGVKVHFQKLGDLRSIIAIHKTNIRDIEIKLEEARLSLGADRYDPQLRELSDALLRYRSKFSQAESDFRLLTKITDSGRARYFGVGQAEKRRKVDEFFASRGKNYVKNLEKDLKYIHSKAIGAWDSLGLGEIDEEELSKQRQKREKVEQSVQLDDDFYMQLGVLLLSVAMIWGIFVAVRKLSKRAYGVLMRAIKRVREKHGWLPGKKMTPQVARELARQTSRLPVKDQLVIRKVTEDARKHRSKYKYLGTKELQKREASIAIASLNSELLDLPFGRVHAAVYGGNLSLTELSTVISDWTISPVECIASKGVVYINGPGLSQVMLADSYGRITAGNITSEITATSSIEDILLEWESMQWED